LVAFGYGVPGKGAVEGSLVVAAEDDSSIVIIIARWLVSPSRGLDEASRDSAVDKACCIYSRCLTPNSENAIRIELSFESLSIVGRVLDQRE